MSAGDVLVPIQSLAEHLACHRTPDSATHRQSLSQHQVLLQGEGERIHARLAAGETLLGVREHEREHSQHVQDGDRRSRRGSIGSTRGLRFRGAREVKPRYGLAAT